MTFRSDVGETQKGSLQLEDGAGEGGLPLLGHMLEFGKNPFHFMTKARAECGELAEFKLFGDRLVLMTGPEANEALPRPRILSSTRVPPTR